MLFRGQFTISLDRARRGTFYKYLVVKKGAVHYEDLSEFSTSYFRDSIVNRVLKIPEQHIKAGGKLTSVSSFEFHGMCHLHSHIDYLSLILVMLLSSFCFFAK